MKKTRFTETQIVKAIQEHENGRKAEDICRELGITSAAFYKWRQRYGGLEAKRAQKAQRVGRRKCKAQTDVCKFEFDT